MWWPYTSSKSINDEEKSLKILFFIMYVAHFASDIQSVIFETYVYFVCDVIIYCCSYILFVMYNYYIVTHNIIDVMFTSNGHHMLFINDMFLNRSYSCVYFCISTFPIMEQHVLFLLRSH